MRDANYLSLISVLAAALQDSWTENAGTPSTCDMAQRFSAPFQACALRQKMLLAASYMSPKCASWNSCPIAQTSKSCKEHTVGSMHATAGKASRATTKAHPVLPSVSQTQS